MIRGKDPVVRDFGRIGASFLIDVHNGHWLHAYFSVWLNTET
jgi:hypothetical protein